MTGIDIALIVIGAVLIVISYLVSEKITGEHKKDNNNVMEVWSNKDEMTVKDRVQLLVADKSEQIMDNAEERLCQISNNKIMEFQEYSDQILSKLEENHSKHS